MPSFLSRISRPSPIVVRSLAFAVLVGQTAIAVTGSIVRVTDSGLGCPTWPQCFPGSMVPVSNADIAPLHQAIEFGNRMLGGVLGILSVVCFLAVWRARPFRRRLVLLALMMPLGVVVQAVLGGITVLMRLDWWTVAIHFVLSPPLVWIAVILFKATGEGDRPPQLIVTTAMRRLLVALAVVSAAVIVAGTLVTGAGPHAGNAQTPRLDLPISALAQGHGMLVMAYICLLAVFGVWLRNIKPTKALVRTYVAACVVVLAQGVLGIVQYALGVPDGLVVLHVLGAMLVVIMTAALWGESRYRGPLPQPEPQSVSDTAGSPVTV